MKIILDEQWSIEGVPLNYVLKQKRLSSGTGKNKGTTRMIEDEVGYYTTVEAAIRGFTKKVVKERTEDFQGDLDGYCKRIENIMDTAVEKMRARYREWQK